MKRYVLLALAVCVALTLLPGSWLSVAAHETRAYSHDAEYHGQPNPHWMASLDDRLRLSQLSIPGTHDTGTFHGVFSGDVGGVPTGDLVSTQSLDLLKQLNAGIRAWDIRLKVDSGTTLSLYHGPFPLSLTFETNVMAAATQFLAANPTETLVMRVNEEAADSEPHFTDLVTDVLQAYSAYIYQGIDEDPMLRDIRGKIVVVKDFKFSTAVPYGFLWGDWNIQDAFELDTNLELAAKWTKIRQYLSDADRNNGTTIFVNFLSGAGKFPGALIFPYFVASGHSSHETDAPRLATGFTRGVIDTCSPYPNVCIPEYPSPVCFLGTCGVLYEGTNILARNYIHLRRLTHLGLVMADFPGDGLIETIIRANPSTAPPVPDSTPPVITPTVTGTVGNNDWYLSDVTVEWSVVDPETEIVDTSGCETQHVVQDVEALTITCTALSGGGTSSESVKIKRDTTPPHVAFAAASPLPNGFGWNNTDVRIQFAVTDATSGVFAVAPPTDALLFTSEGAGMTGQVVVVDLAGNTTTALSPPVNIDKTRPSVSCAATPDVLWPANHKLVPVGVSVIPVDALAGIDSVDLVSATSNEPDSTTAEDVSNDIQGFVVGVLDTNGLLRAERAGGSSGRTYSLTYAARDRAGNTASCTATISVPPDQRRP
jgi:1-phosphatidylinositol phosphodiesterase